MKIRFFAAIDEDRAHVDTAFRGRTIDLDVIKPKKVSLVADEGYFFLSIHCHNPAFDCEYKFNDYNKASLLFSQICDHIEKHKRDASSSSSNADEMAAVFYQP